MSDEDESRGDRVESAPQLHPATRGRATGSAFGESSNRPTHLRADRVGDSTLRSNVNMGSDRLCTLLDQDRRIGPEPLGFNSMLARTRNAVCIDSPSREVTRRHIERFGRLACHGGVTVFLDKIGSS